MTDYVIETDFQGPGFVAVPNHVAQCRALSPEGLGVLVYLASQPRGYIARWVTICERFGIGKDKWQRIARELRAVGAMQLHDIRGAGGRIIGRRVSVRWPELNAAQGGNTESRKIRLSDRKPEKPAAGKSAKVSGQIRQSERANPAPYKEQDKEGARAETGSPAARSASSRCETARAEQAAVTAQPEASRGAAGRAPVASAALAAEERARRAAVAASLGLPHFDHGAGAWMNVGMAVADG